MSSSSRAPSPKPMEWIYQSPAIQSRMTGLFRRRGWPSWTPQVAIGASLEHSQFFFTIQMDPRPRAYVQHGQESPYDTFIKTTSFFQTVREKLLEKGDEGLRIIAESLTRSLAHTFFGSNYIERAGLCLEETIKICEKIWKGEKVDAEDVPETEPDYWKQLLGAFKCQPTRSEIIRSRREVIQHAQAMQYILGEMVVRDKPLSEIMIRHTHRILTENIDTLGGTRWSFYAGTYRVIPVAAGSTNFVAPHFVPQKMKELVEEFNADIERAESRKAIDPFTLAAKYCNDFVMIHPFLDGNGRMCRLILNAILLKYAGVVVSIGENEESRDEYLAIQKRAGERMEGSGELASLVLRKAMSRYRKLKQRLTGKSK